MKRYIVLKTVTTNDREEGCVEGATPRMLLPLTDQPYAYNTAHHVMCENMSKDLNAYTDKYTIWDMSMISWDALKNLPAGLHTVGTLDFGCKDPSLEIYNVVIKYSVIVIE